jgi:hypothetical protein
MKFSRLLITVNSHCPTYRVNAEVESDVSETIYNLSSGTDVMCGTDRSVYTNLKFPSLLFINQIVTNMAAMGRVKWSPIESLVTFRFV